MDGLHETSIKYPQFVGLTSISEMFLKAIVSFALLAVAIAAWPRPRVGLQMPILPPISPQVVGGEPAPEGAYPYIVSLDAFSQHFCAGSILNERWIITAAHCIRAVSSANYISVRAGKHNILRSNEPNEQRVKVSQGYVHEKYAGGVGPYDIGLLKLASPLKLTNRVQAIELAPPESDPSGEAWLAGWGSVSNSHFPKMPAILQHVQKEYVDRDVCHESVMRLTGSSPVHETNVCTGPLYDKISACSGDSGGPLVSYNGQKPVLTGIVSWGIIPCGTAGAPSVYTRVSKFNDWIAQKIGSY